MFASLVSIRTFGATQPNAFGLVSIAALQANGYLRQSWNHGTLQRLFNQELIAEKGEYPNYFAKYLRKCYNLRVVADYQDELVTEEESEEALNYTREFAQAVEELLNRG